ncbi:zf-C3HC4-domain-containing protein [Conidiobolus coronatus NRRL 28638]|uniref:RING-type E3 ubiquitin transferase n=1 Tax=Conidiobolus coronatus (strain ATCC 28846 / CBS 209.66 / NRRL 28638) TaxID=796925 RepID=A0A137PDR4_CONC2|nr:zf-C3HC4-domain-containing protein [Conidiobolus coronatus NRRL 28638]|eukprot:KXN73137.1 zf-C3HC4-domain-containing protein [Conidiobolus coronatus NRRL 28638]
MDEDIEFCRVCRGEATDDQPLFHPCKCSGSIRYVHQDCLIQWLNHSRKKHCELCKHQFTFTPVYRNDMPENLPYYLIAKGLFFQLISGLILFIRAHFVIIIWLVFLPNFISNLSRGSFLSVKNLFNYFILNRPEMKTFKPEDFIEEASKNATKISDIDLVPSSTYEFLFSSSDENGQGTLKYPLGSSLNQ